MKWDEFRRDGADEAVEEEQAPPVPLWKRALKVGHFLSSFPTFPPFPATENLITTRGVEYPSLIVYSNGSGGFYVAGGGQRAG